MKRNFRTLGFAATAALLASCGAPKSNDAASAAAVEEEAPIVSVTQAVMGDVVQSNTYTSTVNAYAVNNIAPQSASRIKKINVEIGDFVKAGQVLAEMDVANLEQTRIQMINDSIEFERGKGLYEVGASTKSELDQLEMTYLVRKSTYENLLENTILTTPISGVVTARNYDQGDMYSGSQPLYTVQQITPVKLLVGISESEYTKVKKGDEVTITVEALQGETFKGEVERIYPTIDESTHTFTAEVKVPNKDKKLRPGMYAKVVVTFGTNHSVIIPDTAVTRQQGSGDKYVYILNEDNTVSYTKVTLGVRKGTEYEVLDGVADGDKVVVEGQLKLRDGIKVQVVE